MPNKNDASPRCAADDACGRRPAARGLCKVHWHHAYGQRACIEPGCVNKATGVHYGIGYCKGHASVAICLGCVAPVEKGVTGKQRCWCPSCDTCTTGCGRRRDGRNVLCSMHVRRYRRRGSLDLPGPRLCTEQGCERKHYGVGLCRSHWKRRYRADPANRQRAAVYCARRRAAHSERYERLVIFERDGWICRLCLGPIDRIAVFPDARSPSIDHRVPISKGGHDTEANVQAAHLICNMSKGNRGGDPPAQKEDPEQCLPFKV